jgi:hypothetical protein
MKQPGWALPGAGGIVVLGLAAVVVSAYRIADCIRYQSRESACVPVVEAEAFSLLSGLAAATGPLTGYMIYNRKLEGPEEQPAVLATTELPVEILPELEWKEPKKEVVEPVKAVQAVTDLPAGWRIDDLGRFRDLSGRVAGNDRRLKALAAERGR